MNFYTGIGSRKAPRRILDLIEDFARCFALVEYCLRSGGADGADSAFERGADAARGQKQIFLPWPGFNGNSSTLHPGRLDLWWKAQVIAAEHHPAWKRLDMKARALHTRNVFQVLGDDLASPSDFIVCWTEGGELAGGTSQALRIAKTHDVPVYNLGAAGGEQHVEVLLKRLESAL